MSITLALHIAAGSLGLVSGFLALYAAKGTPLHRKAGMVFVAVMLTMALSGAWIAATRNAWPLLNIPAGLTTAYLVVTGLTTVRPLPRGGRAVEVLGLLVAIGVSVLMFGVGFSAVAQGGSYNGMPAFPFFMFALFTGFGAIGDLRASRARRAGNPLRGAPRLARHLWRMGGALWIAAMSFVIGQADVIPKPLRIMPLLALPVVAVLVTVLYWVWRVRIRRMLPLLAGRRPPEVARSG